MLVPEAMVIPAPAPSPDPSRTSNPPATPFSAAVEAVLTVTLPLLTAPDPVEMETSPPILVSILSKPAPVATEISPPNSPSPVTMLIFPPPGEVASSKSLLLVSAPVFKLRSPDR